MHTSKPTNFVGSVPFFGPHLAKKSGLGLAIHTFKTSVTTAVIVQDKYNPKMEIDKRLSHSIWDNWFFLFWKSDTRKMVMAGTIPLSKYNWLSVTLSRVANGYCNAGLSTANFLSNGFAVSATKKKKKKSPVAKTQSGRKYLKVLLLKNCLIMYVDV